MDMDLDQRAARLALAVGVVALGSLISLAVFFAVGGPFGAINDWSIGVFGALSALLAFVLYRRGYIEPHGLATLATGTAILGAVIVVVGAALVITDTSGFLLAGLVESVGFALVGFWLIALSRSMASAPRWPRRLPFLGIVAGIVMAIGIIVIPGVAMGLDDMETAPGWVWIGFIGWLGIFLFYPIWSLWFGSVLRQGTNRRPTTS
ncbi:MAG TPA: hypothetical protein VGQ64_08020 [Candidatus Limnocylindrales bacterium]|jgi:hypothetical protein|nr:hypothetical protein [Candidatus Limnocylindrales bacterium]